MENMDFLPRTAPSLVFRARDLHALFPFGKYRTVQIKHLSFLVNRRNLFELFYFEHVNN